MAEPAKVKDRATQVVVLASGNDPTRLRLSAAEGYLLSRIDGRTPWRLLREIGGIPAADVDACLERWLAEGVLEIVGGGGDRVVVKPAPTVTFSRPIDPSLLDPGLDIDCDVQRRILEFEGSLDRPYHELLGVVVGADPKTVKRAYFKLSKEFHPDRYFRREIGAYQRRLERIFKKVLEAHEILSDPELCQVGNQPENAAEGVAVAVDPALSTMSGAGTDAVPSDAAKANDSAAKQRIAPADARPSSSSESGTRASANAAAPPAAGEVPPPPRAQSKLERLKQRMPFKIDPAAMAARRTRALEIFRAAEASLEAGRFQEAESGIRIAITFDPARAEFKEALGALRIRAAGDRATKLLATPSERMNPTELRDALQLLEDVLPYRPHDPELNQRAAHVCLRLGRHAEALEYVDTLLDSAPDVASHHSLRGRIEKERGDLAAAQRAYQKALELDREDLEARRAIASMRIAAHDAARGGRR